MVLTSHAPPGPLVDEAQFSGDLYLRLSDHLPRCHERAVVARGLEQTRGNYKLLVCLFNMPREDYKRFVSSLRNFDCHLPLHTFRARPSRAPIARGESDRARAAL